MKSQFIQDLQTPADPDRFLAMTQVYQAAARVPLAPRSGPGLHLADIPINRGMLAVVGAMRKHGDSDQALRATTMRMMHLDEIFEARDHFGYYIRPGMDDEGSIEVADVLMKAVAVARILPLGDGACFDLADVLAHAQRFDAADNPAASSVSSRAEV